MNGYCKTLGCFFGAILDPSEDEYVAVYVYRDGIAHEIGRAKTEEEAEAIAGAEHERQLQDNGQFGAGA